MKKLVLAVVLVAGCGTGVAAHAQGMEPGKPETMEDKSKRPSPPREANVDLHGKNIHIDYSAPSLRGRKALCGELMPCDTWWRTGANEATTFETTGDLIVGSLHVPAGKYTIVTYPSMGTWQLVICKKTGQWGTERSEAEDLGKTAMMKTMLAAPQEVMSISFEKTVGAKTQLHVKWETTDVWVPVEGSDKGSLKIDGPKAHLQPLTTSK
jgi:hypothetical protein